MSKRLIPIPQLSKEALRKEADDVVARGHILAIAPDGSVEGPSIDLGAGGLPEVRVGPLVARVIHRYRCENVFRHGTWEEGRVRTNSTSLPRAEADEPFDDFFARWLVAYRKCILDTLSTIRPEDLRLNSGLWRGIKHL